MDKIENNLTLNKEQLQQIVELSGNIKSDKVCHRPIVRAYLQKLDIIRMMNELMPTDRQIEPGIIVAGLISDVLSGRSPLYRLASVFKGVDIPLALGVDVDAAYFNDDNVGRTLDLIYENGTQKLFSAISKKAVDEFSIDTSGFHTDTTSTSVWGEKYTTKYADEINVTYGHSKDHRKDLKQFITSLICVEKNIPIMHSIEDGNAQDKQTNNKLLTRISQILAKNKISDDAFTYIADSALVTKENLEELNGRSFITRLPANYKECARVIDLAVKNNEWKHVGKLAENVSNKTKNVAEYVLFETTVELYETSYRAIVVHSSNYHTRMEKRLLKRIDTELNDYTKQISEQLHGYYECREDAEQAIQKIHKIHARYHNSSFEIEEKPVYARGRTPKNEPRKVVATRYLLRFAIKKNQEVIENYRFRNGCFVLIAPNMTPDHSQYHSPEKMLSLYKEQHGVERNFSFLKDPLIVNDLFLKSPARIEALGFILVLSLLVWNLIERSMRQYAKNNPNTLIGWDNRKTNRPTSFMLMITFQYVKVLSIGDFRWFGAPLDSAQEKFLDALGLPPSIFLDPHAGLN